MVSTQDKWPGRLIVPVTRDTLGLSPAAGTTATAPMAPGVGSGIGSRRGRINRDRTLQLHVR